MLKMIVLGFFVMMPLAFAETALNLSATESMDVTQDLLTAHLRVEKEGKDAKAVQNEINTLIAKAVAEGKKVDSVKVSTQGYYVHQYRPYDRDTKTHKEPLWKGNQSLSIEGKEADDLLKLAGTLQDMGLIMSGLNYSLSPRLAEDVKDTLMEQAIEKLKTRANRAAKALSKQDYEFIEVSLDSNIPQYGHPPMMRAMSMDNAESAKMATPTAEPGESQVSMTVSARVLLK